MQSPTLPVGQNVARAVHAGPAAPRSKRVEPEEPVHGMGRRRPDRARSRRSAPRRARSRDRARAARRGAHLGPGARDPHRRARARRMRAEVDSRPPFVAVERTALRRPPGQGQARDHRAVRCREGEGMAALVRRAPARSRSDAREEREALGLRRSLRRAPRDVLPRRVPEGRARADAALVVRRDRARPAHRRDGARRRARQLVARARQASRRSHRRRGRRAQPPDRRAVGATS